MAKVIRLLCACLLLALFARPAPAADADLRPFAIDWSKTGQSVVNHSGFLDAPAGKAGFVRVEGAHTVTGDGKRFRVWGINTCGPLCFPEKSQATQIADDFARMGFNCVRFHHMDADWGARNIFDRSRDDTRVLDPISLDRLDFFVAELKKRGIYTNLNLNVHRKYKAGDGVRDFKDLGAGKGATYFDPRLIELQHEFARQLLTHKNPYTGNEYRHEPAIAVVEIVNENSLLEAWAGWRLVSRPVDNPGDTWSPLPASYTEQLTDLYNAWLEKNLSPTDLEALRAEAGAGPGGRVPRLMPEQFEKASKLRFHSEARFLMETEARFFAGMRKLLKEDLGVRSLLVGSADHNDRISGYPHIASLAAFDVVDGHGYWQHPEIGAITRSPNTPMVNDPLDSTVVQFARTPVAGKPFTVSETNQPFPHEYACENYPILTAYALLHDWDGVYWFDYGAGRFKDPAAGIPPHGWFDVSNDPVKLTSLAACAAMWHRRDVRPAPTTHVRRYGAADVRESLRMNRDEHPFFTPGFARSTALQTATRLAFEPSDVVKPAPFPPAAPLGEIVAETGQLGWFGADRGKGVVTIDTDHTQALIGFVRDGGRKTGGLSADVANDFCAIVCTSADAKRLNESTRLLLAVTSRATNSDFRWQDDRKTVANWGTGPTVIEPVRGTVTLGGLGAAKAVTARPLAAEGRPLGQTITAKQTGDVWQIPVGEPVTTWYSVDVER